MKAKAAKAVLFGTVAALALSGTAHATDGWYLGLEAGANWVSDNDLVIVARPTTTPTTTTTRATASFETGWAVLATVGYGFWSGWRVEGEVGYRANDIDQVRTPSGSIIGTGNDLTELTLMANILYDIPLDSGRFKFTLGAGAGGDYARLQTSGAFEDQDWFFAYQGIAGFSYALTPRADLSLNYRYLRVADPDFNDFLTPANINIALEDLQKHTLTLGLRYALAGPEAPPPPIEAAPPPPPPPPPPPSKSFLIFFGFNKCNITSEADHVLSEAVDTARSTGSASVTIVGHTDTSGSARYNQKLSECRAGAAKSNMVSKGIPAGSISATGKGETELMVQTGDGVKEPQNRRATIDMD